MLLSTSALLEGCSMAAPLDTAETTSPQGTEVYGPLAVSTPTSSDFSTIPVATQDLPTKQQTIPPTSTDSTATSQDSLTGSPTLPDSDSKDEPAAKEPGAQQRSSTRRSISNILHPHLNQYINSLLQADASASWQAKEKLEASLLKHKSSTYIDLAMQCCVERLTDSLPEHVYQNLLHVIDALIKAGHRSDLWFPILQSAIAYESTWSCTINVLKALLRDNDYAEKPKIYELVCKEVERLHRVNEQNKEPLRVDLEVVTQEVEALRIAETSVPNSEALQAKETELEQVSRRLSSTELNLHRRAGLIILFEMLHWRGFPNRPDVLREVVGDYTYGEKRPDWLEAT